MDSVNLSKPSDANSLQPPTNGQNVKSTLPAGTKRTRSQFNGKRTAPSLHTQVIARRAAGESKRKIARELSMSVNTVKAIVNQSQIDADYSTMAKSIIPLAFDTVQDSLQTKRDGNLAMRYLENTVFKDTGQRSVIDTKVNVAVGLLTSTPMSTGTAMSSGQASTNPDPGAQPTQAAAKAPPADECEPMQAQFFKVLENNRNRMNNLQPGISAGEIDRSAISDLQPPIDGVIEAEVVEDNSAEE